MFFRTLLLLFLCTTFLHADPLFDQNDCPNPKLLQLLHTVGMDTTNPTPSNINDWAQKNLLRQGERWEQQSNLFESLSHRIKPLLTDLGFVSQIDSPCKTYQGAIVHGALLSTVCLRLQFLVEQWNQGTRFNHLYFLTGERSLEESEKLQLPQAQTENVMVELVWRQTPIPQEMRQQVQVHFINAPAKQDPFGRLIRPNTNDTVEAWLKTSPPCGRYLAVTNNPHIIRQDLVIKKLSPTSYTFDTVGPAANEQEKMAVFLDELARAIFTLHH